MVPGNVTDANVTSYKELGCWSKKKKKSKSYGWLYQRSQRLWEFLNFQAANMGAKEDIHAEKLSYRVLNFGSARGNVVHEVFFFKAYVVTNIIFLFLIWYIVCYDMIFVHWNLEMLGEFKSIKSAFILAIPRGNKHYILSKTWNLIKALFT